MGAMDQKTFILSRILGQENMQHCGVTTIFDYVGSRILLCTSEYVRKHMFSKSTFAISSSDTTRWCQI
ncbi:hypothetical protein Y032_0256g350 [Ancylostoma ceylanicum]|uniref:Uncharacterized protein n=1 Tax=Ancylostoma ceylanicum TaxID=53326 RepID=A0A016SAW9_9BILA|nr:hypothetical protein Y032_0256g350 [Ancylostoma ceylanicum]